MQWADKHANHETRKYRYLQYVLLPNKLDGLTYRRIMREPTPPALYAGWVSLLQISSKNSPEQRGWIVRDGRPLLPQDLADISGFAREVFESTLEFFSRREIGWLVLEDFPPVSGTPGESPGTPGESPGTPGDNRRGPGEPPAPTGNGPAAPGLPPVPCHSGTGTGTGTDLKNKKGRNPQIWGSRTRWAALSKRIKELEKTPREDLDPEDREELQKLRAQLAALEKAQREGRFD